MSYILRSFGVQQMPNNQEKSIDDTVRQVALFVLDCCDIWTILTICLICVWRTGILVYYTNDPLLIHRRPSSLGQHEYMR